MVQQRRLEPALGMAAANRGRAIRTWKADQCSKSLPLRDRKFQTKTFPSRLVSRTRLAGQLLIVFLALLVNAVHELFEFGLLFRC